MLVFIWWKTYVNIQMLLLLDSNPTWVHHHSLTMGRMYKLIISFHIIWSDNNKYNVYQKILLSLKWVCFGLITCVKTITDHECNILLPVLPQKTFTTEGNFLVLSIIQFDYFLLFQCIIGYWKLPGIKYGQSGNFIHCIMGTL